MTVLRRLSVGAVSLLALSALTGCTRTPAAESAGHTSVGATPGAAASAPPTAAPVPDVAVPGDLIGPGCTNYAVRMPVGPGSLDGMGRDPVATAVANSALLTTLAGALSGKLNPDVNLVDALNAGQFTLFAPTDEAFGRLDPPTVEKLKKEGPLLTAVLKYHVVEGQTGPGKIAGEHKTLQGAPLTVTGSGNDLKVNGATVVCGGIKTANATVYLIDTVLMPPAPPPATSPTGTSATSTTPTS